MTRIILKTALPIILILLGSCRNQHPLTTTHITRLEAGHSRQGFYYALPRNVITIDVTVIKTTENPGPFASFAGKYLSLDNVITQTSTRYSIGEIVLQTYAEPDPTEYYFVEYVAEKNHRTPFSLHLSEYGTIAAVNKPTDPEGDQRVQMQRNLSAGANQSAFNQFINNNLQERIDTIVERVRMDTVTVERKVLRRTWVEKSSEVRAREIADYILAIRKKRFDLVSGFAEVTYSRETLEYMNKELARMENDYLELFTGITTQSATRYRFTWLPVKGNDNQQVTLFHFDPRNGIVSEESLSTETIKLNIARDLSTRQLGVFTINPSGKKMVERGIYYRIPEYANITINRDKSTLAEARLLIGQFGVVTSLPPDNLKIEFYPGTGTIRSVERLK